MANQRSSSWFLGALIALAAFAVQPAAAKPRDLSDYPLRIQIFQSDWQASGSYWGQGSGVANLIDGQAIHGIDFAYQCPIHYMKSVGNQAYPAKWKKPETTIEIVGGKVGSPDKSDTCEFKVTFHDYVYDVQNGTLTTFTQEQYKVRVGAALPKSEAVDSDISHYPLRLSVLKIDWAPPLNGTRAATGQGNVRTPAGLSSVDFTSSCGGTFAVTAEDRYYPTQWIQEGSMMTVLLHATSGGSLVCILRTTAHTDVYVLDASGGVKAISQEEYRKTPAGIAAFPPVSSPSSSPGVAIIGVPPYSGVPFTGDETIVWTHMVNGTTVTGRLAQTAARDGQGRVYSENRRLNVGSGDTRTALTRTTVLDPVVGTATNCDFATHVCQVTTYAKVTLASPMAAAIPSAAAPSMVLIDNGKHQRITEPLGTKTIDGLPTIGTRRTTSPAPGLTDTDPTGNSTIETWISSNLRTDLAVTRSFPNGEIQDLHLKILSQTEPDPSLFAIPAGFTVQRPEPKIKMPDPTIEVQKTLKMANSPLIGVSMGNGSGSGLGDIGPLRKMGGRVSAPVVIFRMDAQYSEEARNAKFMGAVLVNLIVDTHGMPQNVHILRGAGMGLDERAVESVKQYRFEPAMEDGKPVAVQLNVDVDFKIFGSPKADAGGSGPGGLRKIGGAVSSPVVIYEVSPEFPEAARKAKLMGVVLVNLIVGQNGRPQNVHVLRGIVGPDGKPDPKVSKEIADGFGQKAVDAVKQYRFTPAMEDGKPVSVELNVEVNFQVF